MAQHSVIWFSPVAFAWFFSTLGCSDATNYDRPELADPDTGIILRLTPEIQTIKTGQSPRFTAVLVNGGKRNVVLVAPGDGSDCGWRTPLVEWSGQQYKAGGRCGHINALKPAEVFTLEPGQSHELNEWIGDPHLSRAGRYRIALQYSNQPERKWSGIPLAPHDPKALEAVRHSTPVTVVSNTVEIVVE